VRAQCVTALARFGSGSLRTCQKAALGAITAALNTDGKLKETQLQAALAEARQALRALDT
jgi:hypothetical protein